MKETEKKIEEKDSDHRRYIGEVRVGTDRKIIRILKASRFKKRLVLASIPQGKNLGYSTGKKSRLKSEEEIKKEIEEWTKLANEKAKKMKNLR